MDGTLTQDEINALLNGMDLSDSSNNASKDEPAGSSDDAPAATAGAAPASNADALTDIAGCNWRNCQYQHGVLCNNVILTGQS